MNNKEIISVEESINRKIKTIKNLIKKSNKIITRFEFKVIIFLVILSITSFSGMLIIQKLRINRVSALRTQYCAELTPLLNEQFNSSLTCNCYFDLKNTGNNFVDQRSEPLCTCECTDGITTRTIALRIAQ